jgi:hypothetical protein
MRFIVQAIKDFRLLAGLQVNSDKSKILKLGCNATQYGTPFPEVDFVDILGIRWYKTVSQSAQYNLKLVTHRIVRDCIQYKHAFRTIANRAKFLNVYVLSKATYIFQLFLLSTRELALINRSVGNFIWFQQVLRTRREILYLPPYMGGVQLKCPALFNQALLLHRTVEVICKYVGSFVDVFFLRIIKLIEVTSPVYLGAWGDVSPHLKTIFLDIVYSHIARDSLEHDTVSQIYDRLLKVHLLSNSELQTVLNNTNSHVWRSLNLLKDLPFVYDLLFKIGHKIYMTKDTLYRKNIVPENKCGLCQGVDDLEHRFFHCLNTGDIWLGFANVVKRILHGAFHLDSVLRWLETLSFTYFPPAKNKFLLWLFAQTTYWILTDHREWDVQTYLYMVHTSYQLLPLSIRSQMAQFHRAIY